MNSHTLAIADVVIEIAAELNVSAATVALTWVKRNPSIIPIIGARRTEQLKDNLACLSASLNQEQLQKLESVSGIPLGFPHDFIKSDSVQSIVYGPYKNKILK